MSASGTWSSLDFSNFRIAGRAEENTKGLVGGEHLEMRQLNELHTQFPSQEAGEMQACLHAAHFPVHLGLYSRCRIGEGRSRGGQTVGFRN